ncbi:Structural Maintenance Of Chromosomes Protein 1B [Manis pentadactyla]|nr:Structural Maintenance Of Chromosomes Protein 1B [Manis pentadactyla]
MLPIWGPDTCRGGFAMISSGCFCKEIVSVEKSQFSIIYTVIKFISRNGTSQSSCNLRQREKSHTLISPFTHLYCYFSSIEIHWKVEV